MSGLVVVYLGTSLPSLRSLYREKLKGPNLLLLFLFILRHRCRCCADVDVCIMFVEVTPDEYEVLYATKSDKILT